MIPQARQVLGQCKEGLLGLLAQRIGALAHQLGDLFFKPRLHRQCIVPAFLERAGDKTVCGIHGIVLSLRAADLVAGPLQRQALLREPLVLDALQLLDGLHRCLEPQGLKAAQHLLGHQSIRAEAAEHDAAGVVTAEDARGALIANAGAAWVATHSLAPQCPQRSSPDNNALPLLTEPRTAAPRPLVLWAINSWLPRYASPCPTCPSRSACQRDYPLASKLRQEQHRHVKSIQALRTSLWHRFQEKIDVLQQFGYLTPTAHLTEDGEWARLIRIDHSLLITELLRADAFNGADPAMLAAVMSSIAHDDDRPGAFPRVSSGLGSLLGQVRKLAVSLSPYEDPPLLRADIAAVTERWIGDPGAYLDRSLQKHHDG